MARKWRENVQMASKWRVRGICWRDGSRISSVYMGCEPTKRMAHPGRTKVESIGVILHVIDIIVVSLDDARRITAAVV